MSSNAKITAPFLRSSWMFPDDSPQALSVQVDRSYLSIANNVNSRVIGLFPTSNSIVNGEAWFVNSGQKEQGVRQVFTFSGTGSIPHNIAINSVSAFTHCFGSFTDGTDWYGAIFASDVAINGQISFYVTSTDIVILAGAGAPAITSGTIILQWRSIV